jgi:hypothetical protein
MAAAPLPPASEARKRFLLKAVAWMFVIAALIILIAPLGIPRPLRLAMAVTDLFAAAVIGLLIRQRYPR